MIAATAGGGGKVSHHRLTDSWPHSKGASLEDDFPCSINGDVVVFVGKGRGSALNSNNFDLSELKSKKNIRTR